MDNSKQVYVAEATGWQRGLYESIRQTTGMVASLWRTQMYHVPEFGRYAWGQIKPVFLTQEFVAFERAWRDTLLSAGKDELPKYDVPAEVDLNPGEFYELRQQLARFDFIAPRYAVAFELLHRRITGNPVGTEPVSEAATTPLPERPDIRGHRPTMLPQDEARPIVPGSLAADFGEMVPTEYRSLAQWPSFLDQLGTDLDSIVNSDVFTTARDESHSLVETYLDRLAYTPQIDPDTLTTMGFDEETIGELQDFFAKFQRGGPQLMPLLPIYAATVNVAGERHPLTFP